MSAEVIDGMRNADYHAHPALGSTSLKTLATRTPAHWKHESENRVHKDAYDMGTVVHSLVLEQDESGIVIVEADNWLTKAAKEAKAAARADGKVPLLPKEIHQARAMRDSVMADPLAKIAFTGHIAERSIFWEEDGIALKCRPDALNKGLIVDLKTSITADPNDFGKRAYDLGYYISAAHYRAGVREATGKTLPFAFIQVEKEPPYLVSVVELDDDAIDWGERMIDRATRIYKECAEKNEWPGYRPYSKVSLPKWAGYRLEEIEDE